MAFTPAYVAGHFVASINLKSATRTTFIPARSGMKFNVRAVYYIITAFTGTGSLPSFTIEVAGAAFPIALASVPSKGVDEKVEMTQNGTSKPTVQDVGTTGISINVTAASTYTTHTIDMVVEGFYK